MASLVRPRIPRTSLQNEYMPVSMFNAPWVWDPPDNLPETFDQYTENLLNRGEVDSAAMNPDTVQLTEDEEYNLTKWLVMDNQVMDNLPSALTFPTAIEPLTMSSRVPVMPKRLTPNICSNLHSLTSSGPFVDYHFLLTQAANAEDADIPSALTTPDFGDTTVPAALATDVPSFDAMQYISSLARKGLAQEQPTRAPRGSRRVDIGDESSMDWEEIEKRRSQLRRGSSGSMGSAKGYSAKGYGAKGGGKGGAKGASRVSAKQSLSYARAGRSTSPTPNRDGAGRLSTGGAGRQSTGGAGRQSTGGGGRNSTGSVGRSSGGSVSRGSSPGNIDWNDSNNTRVYT